MEKTVEGFVVLVEGKVDTANEDGWGLEILQQMAEADGKKAEIVPCTITYKNN